MPTVLDPVSAVLKLSEAIHQRSDESPQIVCMPDVVGLNAFDTAMAHGTGTMSGRSAEDISGAAGVALALAYLRGNGSIDITLMAKASDELREGLYARAHKLPREGVKAIELILPRGKGITRVVISGKQNARFDTPRDELSLEEVMGHVGKLKNATAIFTRLSAPISSQIANASNGINSPIFATMEYHAEYNDINIAQMTNLGLLQGRVALVFIEKDDAIQFAKMCNLNHKNAVEAIKALSKKFETSFFLFSREYLSLCENGQTFTLPFKKTKRKDDGILMVRRAEPVPPVVSHDAIIATVMLARLAKTKGIDITLGEQLILAYLSRACRLEASQPRILEASQPRINDIYARAKGFSRGEIDLRRAPKSERKNANSLKLQIAATGDKVNLNTLLKSRDPWEKRRRGIEELRSFRGEPNEILQYTRSNDDEIRQAAFDGLVNCAENAIPILLELIEDDNYAYKEDALSALGRLRDVNNLIKLLNGYSHEVAKFAAIALGASGNSEAVKPLIIALLDPSKRYVHREAYEGLKTLAPYSIREIRNEIVQRSAGSHKLLPLLGEIGTPQEMDFLIQFFNDKRKFFSVLAAGALGMLGKRFQRVAEDACKRLGYEGDETILSLLSISTSRMGENARAPLLDVVLGAEWEAKDGGELPKNEKNVAAAIRALGKMCARGYISDERKLDVANNIVILFKKHDIPLGSDIALEAVRALESMGPDYTDLLGEFIDKEKGALVKPTEKGRLLIDAEKSAVYVDENVDGDVSIKARESVVIVGARGKEITATTSAVSVSPLTSEELELRRNAQRLPYPKRNPANAKAQKNAMGRRTTAN
ncbi:MAG: HEAT repeat domain-containing protein [Candidatus Micrarchaeia archaeon]